MERNWREFFPGNNAARIISVCRSQPTCATLPSSSADRVRIQCSECRLSGASSVFFLFFHFCLGCEVQTPSTLSLALSVCGRGPSDWQDRPDTVALLLRSFPWVVVAICERNQALDF